MTSAAFAYFEPPSNAPIGTNYTLHMVKEDVGTTIIRPYVAAWYFEGLRIFCFIPEDIAGNGNYDACYVYDGFGQVTGPITETVLYNWYLQAREWYGDEIYSTPA